MNLCDLCVWNEMATKKQLTFLFHIDDVILVHLELQAMTNRIKLLDKEHSGNDPLTTTRGKIHECLGMTLDFRMKGCVIFAQFNSIKKFWLSLLEDLRGVCGSTPDLENSFRADPNSPALNAKRREDYHAVTAKVRYFSQRSRADLHLSICYHCTRVKERT